MLIKTLIVDDSSFMRKSLTHILTMESSINVIDTAANGEVAIQKVKQLKPDVVLLDIEMPVMDGLTALAYIMSECPTPVLMLSALNKRDAAIAIKSCEYGAVDFIPKPSGVISYDIEKLSHEIVAKVKVAASVDVRKIAFLLPDESFQKRTLKPLAHKKMVVIGASTGGPRAVAQVLAGLPRDISTAIVVVQHMSPEFVPLFVDRLQWGCSVQISIAKRGEVITPGRVLIAPGDYQTTVIANGKSQKIRLGRNTSSRKISPSIDGTMQSAARIFGSATLGVLLTGLGNDGAQGLKAIKEAGGNTIAEAESSCVVFGMPKAAIELGCVDEVVPLPQIAHAILRMT